MSADDYARFLKMLSRQAGEEVERIRRALKPCLAQLAAAERELPPAYRRVVRGRARAGRRRRLAESRRTTVLALRMRVTRPRTLTDRAHRSAGSAPASR